VLLSVRFFTFDLFGEKDPTSSYSLQGLENSQAPPFDTFGKVEALAFFFSPTAIREYASESSSKKFDTSFRIVFEQRDSWASGFPDRKMDHLNVPSSRPDVTSFGATAETSLRQHRTYERYGVPRLARFSVTPTCSTSNAVLRDAERTSDRNAELRAVWTVAWYTRRGSNKKRDIFLPGSGVIIREIRDSLAYSQH